MQKQYDVKVYIDSQDPSMPKITTATTAANLKARIKKCDKFILLATNAAIDSKWCNWELGYGDAQKFKAHIALFPLKPRVATTICIKGQSICHFIHISVMKMVRTNMITVPIFKKDIM